jgi:hypothetical protein
MGNLFYGNTASSFPVVCIDNGTVNASYNVVDVAFGTGSSQCGWTQGSGDTSATTLPISPKTFKLLSGSEAASVIDSLPADYPVVDFYGQPISTNAAAGAAQAAAGSGYYLGLSVNNDLAGTVGVSPPSNADGLFSAPFTITASPNSGYTVGHWLVNGIKTVSAPTSLSDHAWVQVVFNRTVTVNVFADGPGSATTPGTLRYALTNVQEGDVISFSGVTAGSTVIELERDLPQITKSIAIAGNGVTLTRAASWTAVDTNTGLLSVSGSAGEVTVGRVLFKDGRAMEYGGAIYNNGTLTLESCIFSGNQNAGSYGYGGGAINSANTLTIKGCTFYGNSASNSGGAVCFSASGKTLTLTGNLFYGNTAPSYPVVSPSGTVDASYNVVDVTLGTGSSLAGWTPGTGDTYITTGDPIDAGFAPNPGSPGMTEIGIVPADLADFPTTDFYGNTRTFPGGAAGAVK